MSPFPAQGLNGPLDLQRARLQVQVPLDRRVAGVRRQQPNDLYLV